MATSSADPDPSLWNAISSMWAILAGIVTGIFWSLKVVWDISHTITDLNARVIQLQDSNKELKAQLADVSEKVGWCYTCPLRDRGP